MSDWFQKLKGVLTSKEDQKARPSARTASITVQQTGPQRLVLTVRGRLTAQIVDAVQQKILANAKPGLLSRGLIRAEAFTGFAQGAGGEAEAIQQIYAMDEVIERIAVVANPDYHDHLNMFLCGWMRKAEIRFFAPSELAQAQAWLES